MITDVMLQILTTLMDWLIALRPSWDVHLPAGVGTVIGHLKGLNDYLPVTEAITVVGLVCGLVVAMQAVKWGKQVVDWIADVLP